MTKLIYLLATVSVRYVKLLLSGKKVKIIFVLINEFKYFGNKYGLLLLFTLVT